MIAGRLCLICLRFPGAELRPPPSLPSLGAMAPKCLTPNPATLLAASRYAGSSDLPPSTELTVAVCAALVTNPDPSEDPVK